MVKSNAKQHITKNQSGKKTPSANSKQVTASPSASAPPNKNKTAKSSVQVPSCTACGILISSDVKALQCDRCQASDKWNCSECLNLPPDLYDHLVSDPNCSLRWMCRECDKQAIETGGSSCSNPVDTSSDKLDNLIKLVESFLVKLATFEDKIKEKCDLDAVRQLETRVCSLEAHVAKQDTEMQFKDVTTNTEIAKVHQLELEMEKKDSVLKDRLASLEDQVKHGGTHPLTMDKDNAISDEEMIKCMVKVEMEKKSEEERDVERRRKNLIIYRVPEKKTENVADRKSNDFIYIKDLLDAVFNINVEEKDIEKMYRLGQWTEDKARPLLVMFSNYEMKDQVMSNLKNLRQSVGKFMGIGIAHDLPPKEREEIKRMIQPPKDEYSATVGDSVENYKFLVVGKGQKRRVVKLQRNIARA